MKERWRPIPEYEGLYEASNLGNVRSIDRYEFYTTSSGRLSMRFRPGKKLIPICSNSKTNNLTSALYVGLCKNGNTSVTALHKIIATIWVKNPHHYTTIQHKDKNKQNNAASNLAWVPYLHKSNKPLKEEWRPVPSYDGLYEVSRTGRVRSIRRSVQRSRTRNSRTVVDYPKYHPTELKPYAITKKGIKYHLHKRVHTGYYGQSDEYLYGMDLAKQAFPELSM